MTAADRPVERPADGVPVDGPAGPGDALAVAAGGALGTAARHLLGMGLPDDPIATAVVLADVAGALALGLLAGRSLGRRAHLFWRTGAIGAFTTFSAMAAQAVDLGPAAGAAYLVGVVGAGAAAAWLGILLGGRGRSGGGRGG